MTRDEEAKAFDDNLSRMLAASVSGPDADLEARLTAALLAEVRVERRAIHVRRVKRFAFAAAAAIILSLITYTGFRLRVPEAGEVKNIYGIVTVADAGRTREVEGVAAIRPGQTVRTAWGSKAEITLPDKSVLTVGPRTLVTVRETPSGVTLALEEGALAITAAKQAAGKALRVDTPGAQIKVLGTVLDVLVTDSGAPKTTRVSVKSGRVEFLSAGTSVFLWPNMEGIAAPGEPPLTRAMTPEVNEMARLLTLSSGLAKETGAARALPAIIDFSDGARVTAWLAVEAANDTGVPLAELSLKATCTFSTARAFLLSGIPLEARAMGALLHIDMSNAPIEARQKSTIVVALSGVEGLFEAKPDSAFSFDRAATGPVGRMLVEFRLPEAAWVGRISPAPIEEHTEGGMCVFVVDANTQPLGLIEEASHEVVGH